MIIRTFDGLQALTTPAPTWSHGGSSSLNLYGLNQAYAEIYRTQPNVRICVDFLARNIAELTFQVFRRVSDTDRVRLVDHDLARWLGHPNPSTRRYRLIENLMGDLGVYFNGNWIKVRHQGADGRDAIGLVRIPAHEVHVEGTLLPTKYCWTSNGRVKDFALSELVYFSGYNPTNPLMGLSSLETLRRILAEESAAGDYREDHWRHASRKDGIIEQSNDAPKYSDPQKQQFREQLQEFSAGGVKAGMTIVLPKGMTYKEAAFSAKDSEYIQGGKLRREVVAAAYHIPQPLVGILEHATFSNIKEQHKHLYQDCLGPWLRMLKEEIEGQLLIECDDQQDVYGDWNIDAKLAGTPEERAQSLQLSVGKPWRTVNEARALENLPRDPDPESDRIAPQQGGPSDATARPTPAEPAGMTRTDDQGGTTATVVAPLLLAARARQQAALQKLPALDRATAFYADLDRWNRELADDLTPLVGAAAAIRLAEQANTATLTQLLALEAA